MVWATETIHVGGITVIVRRIKRSGSLEEAADRFMTDLMYWAHDCVAKYTDVEPLGGHDQMTYMTCWEPYLRINRDERVIKFMKSERDRAREHFEIKSDLWHHGYWRANEAHHGTEHFELFLGFLLRIDPDDEEIAGLNFPRIADNPPEIYIGVTAHVCLWEN